MMTETLEEYLVGQLKEKQQGLVHLALVEWDKTVGELPPFQNFLLVNLETLWMNWVRRN